MKKEIVDFINQGDIFFKDEKYNEAIKCYIDAEKLIDDETFELYFADIEISIADSYFKLKDVENAQKYFFNALKDSDVENSSFVMLRIGQCVGAQGDIEKAKFYFLKAYQIDGENAFYGHEELLSLVEEVLD